MKIILHSKNVKNFNLSQDLINDVKIYDEKNLVNCYSTLQFAIDSKNHDKVYCRHFTFDKPTKWEIF